MGSQRGYDAVLPSYGFIYLCTKIFLLRRRIFVFRDEKDISAMTLKIRLQGVSGVAICTAVILVHAVFSSFTNEPIFH